MDSLLYLVVLEVFYVWFKIINFVCALFENIDW